MYCQIYPIPGGVRRSNARILFPARHALHKVHADGNGEQPRKPALPQSRAVFADRYRRHLVAEIGGVSDEAGRVLGLAGGKGGGAAAIYILTTPTRGEGVDPSCAARPQFEFMNCLAEELHDQGQMMVFMASVFLVRESAGTLRGATLAPVQAWQTPATGDPLSSPLPRRLRPLG